MPDRLRRDLVPEAFRARVAGRSEDGGPDGSTWLAGLDRVLTDLLAEWDLAPTGPTRTGETSVVVPVVTRTGAGEPLALKVVWPHEEARSEHLALRRWDGSGAVRLVRADPRRWALLLEWADPTHDLSEVWVDEACEVVGGLLARLHVPALPQVDLLSDRVARLVERSPRYAERLPRRFLERATGLAGELTGGSGADGILLHGDLHFENVLAAEREAWLAIDPKPLAGHPGWEVAPLLYNRSDELGTGSALRYLARRRLEVVCGAAGIDEDEARAWTTLRLTEQAMWAVDDEDREHLTLVVALMKALAD